MTKQGEGKRLFRWALCSAVGLILSSICAFCVYTQESILQFTVDPPEAIVASGGDATVTLHVKNGSIYEADDVAVQFEDEETGFSFRSTPSSLNQVPPFGGAKLDLTLFAPESLSAGSYELRMDVIYSYCVDDVCFQIVEELFLPVRVEKGVPPALPSRIRWSSVWGWLIPVLGVVLAAGGIVLWRAHRLTFPLYAVVFVLIAGGLTYGVIHRQHRQAQGIGAVLCTSCVGIEEARREVPQLSPGALAALATLENDVELIVFYAPWCHSCPYAEALVEKMADVSERVDYRFINVDQQRELATSFGVIRSGRTVVPAILRVDSGEVVFGVENLEERLLAVLEVEVR
jgi:thiol-disulfide isomerase/thioredoxin